jgi:hypothetical protein
MSEVGSGFHLIDHFLGTGTMIGNLVKLIEAMGALDMKIVALLVIALAIVAVVIISNGLGR